MLHSGFGDGPLTLGVEREEGEPTFLVDLWIIQMSCKAAHPRGDNSSRCHGKGFVRTEGYHYSN